MLYLIIYIAYFSTLKSLNYNYLTQKNLWQIIATTLNYDMNGKIYTADLWEKVQKISIFLKK